MRTEDSLIIGLDFDYEKETGVLVVGRKLPNQNVDIINAFQGKEAIELYKKLITKRSDRNAQN